MAEDALQALSDVGIILRDDNDAAYWKEAALFKGNHEKMSRLTAALREQMAEARKLNGAIEANLRELGYGL
jgi:hypothetical protein